MSDKRNAHHEDTQAQTATKFCAEMMQKMTGQQEKGNHCAELMYQLTFSCCGPQE